VDIYVHSFLCLGIVDTGNFGFLSTSSLVEDGTIIWLVLENIFRMGLFLENPVIQFKTKYFSRSFRKIAKSYSQLRHVCLSVCPHGTFRLPLEGFPSNLMFVYFPQRRKAIAEIRSCVGHDCLGTQLRRIGIRPDPYCILCSLHETMDRNHLERCAALSSGTECERYWEARTKNDGKLTSSLLYCYFCDYLLLLGFLCLF